ncbi:S-adenosyl-L-methionine-dependent methyltransferase [Phaeosphaeriaceae sp. PMI808]|nr:S-adenosyl-L-methionine-dependent methyltransferase [Phaeosphaeriaceae sp. PMI808]
MPSPAPQTKDWSANQYLKFDTERTRPVHDLITQLKPHITTPTPRIYDLGCGPGNSTQALLSAFPSAHITGLDSSPDMLRKARVTLPSIDFTLGDVATFDVEKGKDAHVLFSNAVFHWLRAEQRIPALTRLFQSLTQGAVLAVQMPDNYAEASHALMRETATMENVSWSACFAGAAVGDLSNQTRPDFDPVESVETFYNALVPFAEEVNVWRTSYHHVLKDAEAVMEWVRGTGLQPFLNRMEDEEVKKAFLREYQSKLKVAYPEMVDGNVLLVYPRVFIVAVRK